MNRKIKILHVIKSLGRGGAEMLLPETLRVHNKDQFEFHYIYFLPWKDAMVGAILEHGGKVTCIAARNNIELLFKSKAVSEYAKTHGIDLIHSHLPWAGIASRMAGKLSGIPVIYTEHNKQERYHIATRLVNLFTLNWLTKIIAVSEDVEQSIRKHKSNLKASLITILNGVNTERFAPGQFQRDEIRKQFNIPDDAPVIGTIAVFRFQKRLDLWIELAKKILEHKSETHFIIVGDGPLKDLLLEKQKQLNLESRIHFAGTQTEVRPYLSTFDLYMMTSIFEGLPIALLEAMASECAVISTNAGGIKEVIRPGIDGLLCDVNEPERLVEFAAELIADTKKRNTLSLKARQRVKEEFSMERMVKALEDVYKQEVKVY
jgi:glycosyltransferase involved in cell wall biosynthesis